MKPTDNKPELLQHLEDLDSLLDHVHPFIHTLRGFHYMMQLYLEEAETLLLTIILVKEEWSKKLPFDNAIDKAVDWEEWSKKLDVNRCVPLFQQWSTLTNRLYIPSHADYVRETELSLKQLKGTMSQLSVELDAVNDLLKSLAPRKLYLYYKERERECEGSRIKEDILPEEYEYYKDMYYKQMLQSRFIRVAIGTNGCNDAESVWQSIYAGKAQFYKSKLGEYIFQHRQELTARDLKAHFRYMQIVKTAPSLEVSRPAQPIPATPQPVIIVQRAHGIFKERYSRYPLTDGNNKYAVNTDLLYTVIQKECLPYIKHAYHWFCLWCVLTDLKLMKNSASQKDFLVQMHEWYPDDCPPADKASVFHDFGPSTYLAKTAWKEWQEAAFKENASSNLKRRGLKGLKDLTERCEKMAVPLKKFCEHPDGEKTI